MKESAHEKNKKTAQTDDHSDHAHKTDPEITAEGPAELEFEPEIADGEEYPNKNKDVITDLRAKLKKAVEEKQEYLLGWQKSKADYINSRRQDEEDNRAAVKYAESGLITELIAVLDSFDMAFANEAGVAKLPEQWKKGITQVRNQLSGILTAHKLEIIDPTGKEFDPREAEAVSMVPVSSESDDHRVMTVLQKGYKLHDRVLRPAKVQVGKFA